MTTTPAPMKAEEIKAMKTNLRFYCDELPDNLHATKRALNEHLPRCLDEIERLQRERQEHDFLYHDPKDPKCESKAERLESLLKKAEEMAGAIYQHEQFCDHAAYIENHCSCNLTLRDAFLSDLKKLRGGE